MVIRIGLILAAVAGGILAVVYGVGYLTTPSQPEAYFAGGSKAAGQDIATPLVGTALVQTRGRDVMFQLLLKDAKGAAVTSLRLPGRGRPDPPEVQVLDEQGRTVHSGTLQYG